MEKTHIPPIKIQGIKSKLVPFIKENIELQVGTDTVVDELKEKNPDLLKALYLLAFKEYEGFNNL